MFTFFSTAFLLLRYTQQDYFSANYITIAIGWTNVGLLTARVMWCNFALLSVSVLRMCKNLLQLFTSMSVTNVHYASLFLVPLRFSENFQHWYYTIPLYIGPSGLHMLNANNFETSNSFYSLHFQSSKPSGRVRFQTTSKCDALNSAVNGYPVPESLPVTRASEQNPGTRMPNVSFYYPFAVHSTVHLWLQIWCSIPLSLHQGMVSLNFND